MKRDKASLEIIQALTEQALNEMPQKVKIRKKTTGYDFSELSPRVKSELSGKDKMDSAKDARERFKQDADLDLKNRLDALIPDTFSDNSLASYSKANDNYGFGSYTYVNVNYNNFTDFICDKFSELERDNDAYGDNASLEVNIKNGASESKLRGILSRMTNFDDLRRQQKVEINNYLIEICKELVKIFRENKDEFEAKRDEYTKYTNLSDKEKEDELSKYWYDQNGRVLKAKSMDESLITELNLTEATDIDTEEYLEIYDFNELSDYVKDNLTSRKVKLQIQKMFDRMTEILEKDFTEYMSQRGLDLEPGQFDIENLLYNMTHESKSSRWSTGSMTKFYITKGELASYIKNNEDLAEKYGQKEIDRLMTFMTTDRGDSQPIYTIYYNGGRGIKFSDNFGFKYYDYDSNDHKYYDGADAKLMKLYDDLKQELSLDFYSSYKLLDKAMKQLRQEAKDIVYAKVAKSKDKYLRTGEKFDKNKYDIIDDSGDNDEK